MPEDRLPLADLLAKAGDGAFLRSVAQAVLHMLMEADVEDLIGAGRHERSGERLNYQNGFHDLTLDTRLSLLQLVGRSVSDPEAAAGQLLPALSRAPEDLLEASDGGNPEGMDRRRPGPASGRAGAGDGSVRHPKSTVSKL
jgi:hypothetical protein